MILRVTDLMIDAAAKKRPRKVPKKFPPTCKPHTAPRCKTCTTITAATKHFTTNNRCASRSDFDEDAVRGELLSQLRVTIARVAAEQDCPSVAA